MSDDVTKSIPYFRLIENQESRDRLGTVGTPFSFFGHYLNSCLLFNLNRQIRSTYCFEDMNPSLVYFKVTECTPLGIRIL